MRGQRRRRQHVVGRLVSKAKPACKGDRFADQGDRPEHGGVGDQLRCRAIAQRTNGNDRTQLLEQRAHGFYMCRGTTRENRQRASLGLSDAVEQRRVD